MYATRRNDLDIQADILRVAMDRGGALKTNIVYDANLNFDIVKGYLERLIGGGLLEQEGPRYFPTEKTGLYLEALEVLYAICPHSREIGDEVGERSVSEPQIPC